MLSLSAVHRNEVRRQGLFVAGALGLVAALLLATGPWIRRGFGADGEVADAGALYLRCLGPYLMLLACFIALGGVFEGSGGSPALVRITACGAVVQLALAYALSGMGLPGICLAMASSMALQCAALARRCRRAGRAAPVRPARGKRRTGGAGISRRGGAW